MSDTANDIKQVCDDQTFFRFPKAYFLYGSMLFISSVTTFGSSGILPALLILAGWACVFVSSSRPTTLYLICVLSLVVFVYFSITPSVQSSRRASRRAVCLNNIKNISLALQNYHTAYGAFPPAYIADDQGQPMHSWRVLILPFLDQLALFREYNFDEPWDSPSNNKLLDILPKVYACPGIADENEKKNFYTNYIAVLGDHTCWPGSRRRILDDIKDDGSKTVQIIEHTASEIPWTKPRDLDLEEAISVLTSTNLEHSGGHRQEDFFYEYFYASRNVAYVDGSAVSWPYISSRKILTEFLTVNDSGPDDDWFKKFRSAKGQDIMCYRKPKLGNCSRFTVFIFLVLFPLPWVWMNPTSGRNTIAEGLQKWDESQSTEN